uniref:Uncharacterized protein n=1 Tax=Peronospora matthiolae TaxID=2874970 RepID=A0AAV1ULL8_9STRA
MRLSATLLLIVAPLHRCVDAVVLIPATTENPFLRSAPSAAADARNDGRSLRELNSAIGFGGEMSKWASEVGGRFRATTSASESVASKNAEVGAVLNHNPVGANIKDLEDVMNAGKDK